MKILRLAMEQQNYKLAAHIVVLKAAEALKEGMKPDVKKDPQGSAPGKSERS